MLERWTRTVLRFRFPVLVLWVGVLVLGIWSASRLSPLLSNSFNVPGTDSERARKILARNFGERTDGTFSVVFRVSHPRHLEQQRLARRRLAAAARIVPTGHADVVRTGAGVVWADLETNLDLRHAKRYTEAVRETLRAQRGPPALVTGQPAIQHDLDSIFDSDLLRGEAFALPIALLVLLAVFGLSLAAAIPFVFAACTITGTLAAVYVVAHSLSMVTYVTNLVELIGLGLAIDYSLLVVHSSVMSSSPIALSTRQWCARSRPRDGRSSSLGSRSRSVSGCSSSSPCRSSARWAWPGCCCRSSRFSPASRFSLLCSRRSAAGACSAWGSGRARPLSRRSGPASRARCFAIRCRCSWAARRCSSLPRCRPRFFS